MNALTLVIAGAVLFTVGRWGYRNAERLVPTTLSEDGRYRKEKSIRRGGMLYQISAVILVVVGVAMVIRS